MSKTSLNQGEIMCEKKTVKKITVSKPCFECPHCGADVDGWMIDPRGRDDTCDDCDKPYTIAADADVVIF
jgi:hypothetical protein